MKPKNHKILTRIAGVASITAAAVMPVRADYPSTLLSYGPVAYWEFNDATTSPAPLKLANSGSVGSAGDAYANTNLITGATGMVGHSLQLVNPVGTGHVDSRVDVVYNPALNPNVFTVEFWVQPSAQAFSGAFDGTGSCPISNFNPENYPGGRVGWLFYLAPTGKWNFRMGLTSGYATTIVGSTGLATAGVWQHIAARYDGTNVVVYANGAVIATANRTTSPGLANWVPNTGSFLRFGGTPLIGDSSAVTADQNYYIPFNSSGNQVMGNRGFDGLLDEVAIYTNALPAATIASHYGAGLTNAAGYHALVLASNPAGYWNFDEPAFTVPSPSALPIAINAGSLGSDADGTNEFGAVAAQPGPSYAGFPAGNKAVSFDGMNGSFAVKDAPALHFTNTLTLAAWIKPTARDYIRDIIAHGPDGGGAETFLRISRGSGYGSGYYYELGASDGEFGAVGYYDSVTFPIPAGDIGNWVFLAGTYDGANWNLYRNGVLVSTLADGNGPVDVVNAWTVGSRSASITPYAGFSSAQLFEAAGFTFAGSIDEPAIFTNALSASDIAGLYAAAMVPPVITSAPQNPGTVFSGSTVSFSVLAEGAPTLGYLWTTNGISTGVTTANYSISNIAAGSYTVAVVVTNPYGTSTPAVTFSAINAPPTISTQPSPETRFVGYPFSFSVVAGGTAPLTYYWKLGGTVVQSGTSATYAGTASLANAGSYTVVVSNISGITITSSPAVLTVNPIPSGYGGAVIGSGPIAYYRLDETPGGTVAHDQVGGYDGTYFNTTLGVSGYSTVDSDTAASFSGVSSYAGGISGTSINFTGNTNFTLEAWVNGVAGQNDEATIIGKGIGNNGTTRSEQFSLDVAAGSYRFFTTGGNTLYDADATVGPNGSWQHLVAVYDGQNLLGGGSNMYIYVNGTLSGTHAVRPVGVNNTTSTVSIGSKRTGTDPNYDGTFDGTIDEVAIYNYPLSAATVQAHYGAAYGTNLAPFIAIQPVPVTNYVGLPVSLSVSAAGSVPLSYQWYQNGSAISGANSSSYVIPAVAITDAGNYRVVISNPIATTNSITVPLGVLSPPTNAPLIPGLVLHLTFNTNLTDVTGRGNDGTGKYVSNAGTNATTAVTNTVTPGASSGVNPAFCYVTDGALGEALHYSTEAIITGGSSSIGTNDYYVTLGVKPDLQFGSNVSFTVSYWVRLPQGYLAGDLPFFTDATGSEGNNGFVFAPAYGYGTASPNPSPAPQNFGGWAETIYGGGNGVRLYGDVGSINDGGWHNLVHVIDRAAGKTVTYLDGAVAHYSKNAGTTLAAAGNINVATPATIGQDPTGQYGESGSADIDDLGVWGRALTPLEAASIYVAATSSGLSFTAPVTLTIAPATAGQVKITWPSGTLQGSASVSGPYTNLPGVVSPYLVAPTGTEFYRVLQ